MLYLPLLSTLATLAIVIVGFVYSNSRLSDFASRMGDVGVDLRGSMNDMRDMLCAELRVVRATMEKNHSEVLGKFAELDGRLSRLEEIVH